MPISETPEIPEPDCSDDKELFAFYGLAAHNSQLVERSVINIFVAIRMVSESSKLSEDIVDSYYAAIEKKTLGQAVREVAKLQELPEDLEELVYEAVTRRNVLIHEFYYDHAEDMMSESGRVHVIDLLVVEEKFFSLVENRLRDYDGTLWEKLGITQEMFEANFEEFRAEALRRGERRITSP